MRFRIRDGLVTKTNGLSRKRFVDRKTLMRIPTTRHFERHDKGLDGVAVMVFELSPRTVFFSVGKRAQVWLEIRSWTGWKPSTESGKGGRTVWWGWLEASYIV